MGSFRFILALAVIVFLVSLGVKNMTPVGVHYYGIQSREYPLFFLLLGAFVLGALMTWLLALAEKLRLKWRLSREQSRLRALESQVQEMEEKSLVPVTVEENDIKEPSLPAEVTQRQS
jgi:uncharacterized integral membrane protein